jgi:vacuolar-type H+-ATPase subunit H
MTPSPNHDSQLKHVIEQKEVEIQAELLKVRKERARLIEQAKKKADLIITEYKEESHERLDKWVKALEKRRKTILATLDKQEEERLRQLDIIWEERGEEILEEILEKILPNITNKTSRSAQ